MLVYVERSLMCLRPLNVNGSMQEIPMAKNTVAAQKLAGCTFAIAAGGPLSWDAKNLETFLTTFGGKITKTIDKNLTYLLIGPRQGNTLSIEEKKVQELNQNEGATIHVLDEDQFNKLAQLTPDEVIGLAKSGPSGSKLLKWVSTMCYKVTLPSLRGADARGAQFVETQFINGELTGVDLRGASFEECRLALDDCQLEGIKVKG